LRLEENVPARVVGDEGRLRQVLTNLLANALKFTEQGEVEATVRGIEEAGSPERVRLLFSVRDTGIGIPAENVATVFDTFSAATRSTHARYGGTGLGLSTARQLVELMGGRIWVESEPGRGSLFQFTSEFALPQASRISSTSERSGAVGSGGPLRVLLAEDNPLNQVYARELLRRLGHEVLAVSDGEEALQAVARETFDAVLMDVAMPELDGEEATRRIRAGINGCPRDLPIIALTAHAVAGDRERFLAAGMDDYLSKPFDPAKLEDALRRAVDRRREALARGAEPRSA
jgi:two-component system CheB/CheR fusion protein